MRSDMTENVIYCSMRGRVSQPQLFSYVDLEERVRPDHPLRRIKTLADAALKEMDQTLTDLYSPLGRESIPPEQLLKASLLQIIYGLRSERQLVERIDDSFTFRWFLDLSIDAPMWVPTVYSKNRDRLLKTEIARSFLSHIVECARTKGYVSQEHFSVDGTLLQAWASFKSMEPIPPESSDDNSPTPPTQSLSEVPPPPKGKDVVKDFRGLSFSNKTHRSRTDPDARLARKSEATAAKLSYLANAMIENRSGLVVDGEVRLACGDGGETQAAASMVDRVEGDTPITVGADKGYDTKDFVKQLQEMAAEPHVARNIGKNRSSAVPTEIAEKPGYAVSIRCRKRIEQVFGWIKLAGCLRQVKIRGKAAVDAFFLLALSAYNLVRMNRLMAEKA